MSEKKSTIDMETMMATMKADIDALKAENAALKAEVAALKEEVVALKEEVATERARADAANIARLAAEAERDRYISQVSWYGLKNVPFNCHAFTESIPYLKMRCHDQYLAATNLWQRNF
jgi:hypothetical protein